MVNREPAQHSALRSDDGVEVGILDGDIVVRRGGWLARMLRESLPGPGCGRRAWSRSRGRGGAGDRGLRRRVLRIYRLGQPSSLLEGVSDHHVVIDLRCITEMGELAKSVRVRLARSDCERGRRPDYADTVVRRS
jgi:hypothetical protein